MPERIQRKRTKGWRMPENAVYVGRGSQWGNPYKVGESSPYPPFGAIDQQAAVSLFASDLKLNAEHSDFDFEQWLAPLAGKNLACWCPLDQPCHADVLLELANRPAITIEGE